MTMNAVIIEGGLFILFFFSFSGMSGLPSPLSFSSSFPYHSLLLGF